MVMCWFRLATDGFWSKQALMSCTEDRVDMVAPSDTGVDGSGLALLRSGAGGAWSPITSALSQLRRFGDTLTCTHVPLMPVGSAGNLGRSGQRKLSEWIRPIAMKKALQRWRWIWPGRGFGDGQAGAAVSGRDSPGEGSVWRTDVCLSGVRQSTPCRTAAQNGWLDERACMLENMLAFKRAGADGIADVFCWTLRAIRAGNASSVSGGVLARRQQ